MQKSLFTRLRPFIMLVPFGYAFVSRYHWPRDFLVNAATAWVPGIILVSLLAELSISSAITTYALGYVAFICIYEVGYLANDTIGLRHDPTPRRRVDHVPTVGFCTAFIATRAVGLAAAAHALGVIDLSVFWASVTALVATLIAHNTLRATELKFYTFLQLSLFRFALPVLPPLVVLKDVSACLITVLTGLLLFSLPRFLTYLDAKGRLTLPERKARNYHLKAHLAVLPLIVLLSTLTREPAPLACLAWGLLVQCLYLVREYIATRTTTPV